MEVGLRCLDVRDPPHTRRISRQAHGAYLPAREVGGRDGRGGFGGFSQHGQQRRGQGVHGRRRAGVLERLPTQTRGRGGMMEMETSGVR